MPANYRVIVFGAKLDQVIFDGFSHQVPDIDPTETEEWLDSFDDVVDLEGKAAGAVPA